MNLNTEMGVLNEGGTVPGNVDTHCKALIEKDVVKRIYSDQDIRLIHQRVNMHC
jgi:hypothetical protein